MFISLIIIFIFLLSIFYSFKYKFIHLHFIKGSKEALKNHSSKMAFLVSLGSHIGAGNILGVTAAIIIGGPGTLFWMVITTVFTTIFSLIENTIALKYRVKIDKENRGGSPYYILFGLKKITLAKVFSIFLVLSSTIFFLPVQVKGVEDAITYTFEIPKFYILIILVFFSIVIIFNGTSTITTFIKRLVPIMTISFLGICLYALINKYQLIIPTCQIILRDALTIRASITTVIIVGIKRSLFSNEAGLGTAPSINAMSDTDKPLNQGYLQVLSCFIDTVVMCVLLGFVIIQYQIDLNSLDESKIAILIFEQIFGVIGKYIGSFFLFAFSLATIVSSYYSGETNMLFNGMIKPKNKKIYQNIYRILFIFGLFIGTFFSNNHIWDLVDSGLVLLGLVNIYALIKLEYEFKQYM